jgi:hypothetical protein
MSTSARAPLRSHENGGFLKTLVEVVTKSGRAEPELVLVGWENDRLPAPVAPAA